MSASKTCHTNITVKFPLSTPQLTTSPQHKIEHATISYTVSGNVPSILASPYIIQTRKTLRNPGRTTLIHQINLSEGVQKHLFEHNPTPIVDNHLMSLMSSPRAATSVATNTGDFPVLN
ncbi:hypothetical protein Mapa_009195 [Marchantia paleacea]|nr:hypothetical protein Mapa_009195 [Marchantia paleacea]